MRCTYAGARVPVLTLTTNLTLVIISPICTAKAREPLLTSFTVIGIFGGVTICLCKARKEPRAQAFRRRACKEVQAAQASRSKVYMEFEPALAVWRRRSLVAQVAPGAAHTIYLRW